VRTGTGQIHAQASDWAEVALGELARSGHRAGGARTAVIELLAAEGGCIDAEQVGARLQEQGRSVGTASVYRALGLLAELGLLRKVAVAGAPVRFELVHPDGHHHHHIVCDGCGRTVAFTDEALERAIHDVSRRASFDVRGHEITLHGICEACR
jgi:Fur family ferric uptake transcriptional regulator